MKSVNVVKASGLYNNLNATCTKYHVSLSNIQNLLNLKVHNVILQDV